MTKSEVAEAPWPRPGTATARPRPRSWFRGVGHRGRGRRKGEGKGQEAMRGEAGHPTFSDGLTSLLKRNKAMKIAKLTGCKNFVGKREKFIFNAFVVHKPMQR